MIHTYKRKGVSLNSCSFYERLCGDSLAGCSAYSTPIEDRMPNGCSSRETEEGVCEAWSESYLPSNSGFFQSQPSERLEAPHIKFKYTRRPKELCTSGRSLHHVELDLVYSNISAKRSIASDCTGASIFHKPDPKGRDGTDGSSYQKCIDLRGTKWVAPLQTYSRRSRKNEDTHRTYVALMAKRNNYLVSDRSFSASAESLDHKAVPKTIDLGNSETVVEHSPSSSLYFEKLTDGVSASGAMISSQGNQKVRNGCQLIDDANVSKIPSFNDEAVTSQQPDDAIKPHRNFLDLSLHTAYEEFSTETAMPDTYNAVFENSRNHSSDQDKAGVASKDLPDKPIMVDGILAASTGYQVEAVTLQSEALQQSTVRNHAASLHAEDPNACPKELLETMRGGVKGTNGLCNINVQPSKDAISLQNTMVYPASLSDDPTRSKVLQLFPEDSIDDALLRGTSNSGLVPAVSSSCSSVTMALPDLSVGCREFIQDKVFEQSSSQASHELLLDSNKSCTRPQMEAIEGFRQNFPPFSSFWCEEELDNLWVGVRRHGKDNWYAMLRDPKLRFSPWRTARDLAEKWIMEKTKLVENSPGPQYQSAKPLGIPLDGYRSSVPPGPGFMTRFLTDPTQLSLGNAYLNRRGQGMFPPRLPHNFTSVPGNGTRLFNRRVRAHRKSQHSENTWGRFKARNQVMSPPQFPTSLASTSRNDILPSYVRDAFDYPHPLPPLPIPPNPRQFHDKLNYKGFGSSRRNGIHLSNTIAGCPDLAFPSTKPSELNPTLPQRPRDLINLESDASSEGTISDDENPTLICK